MKYLLLTISLFQTVHLISQENKRIDAWQFSLTNNHSARPFQSFSRLFYDDFNPGFSVGPLMHLSRNKRLTLEIKLNYFYLQKVQHAISLTSSVGYRIGLPHDFYFYPSIGAGVTQSIHAGSILKLGSDGEYIKTVNSGRTQVLFLINERLEKKLTSKGHIVFMSWQQSIQTPFIKEYVPILPFNSLSFGFTIPNL